MAPAPDAPRALPGRTLVVWLGLVIVTLLNLVLSGKRSAEEVSTTTFAAVVVLAAVKVRYVGLDFMELRTAPRGLRVAFEAYCLALAVALIAVAVAA